MLLFLFAIISLFALLLISDTITEITLVSICMAFYNSFKGLVYRIYILIIFIYILFLIFVITKYFKENHINKSYIYIYIYIYGYI